MKFVFVFALLFLGLHSCYSAASKKYPPDSLAISLDEGNDSIPIFERIREHTAKLNDFLKTHREYQEQFAFLIDMRIHSGTKRFFVVDLKSGEIIKKGLTTHGSGSEATSSDSLIFSNVPNSYCSSLGIYKIGSAYFGNFGRSYKLHGLEPTNNKAFERAVVLHRYSCVPDDEQAYPICNSLGCPMLSENFFPEIDEMIKGSSKPILLEIYY
ncbi:MAG: murein L,D-transpeptidase catalytic domain family protein [Bacteroidetes bacterium]|nr:MAG: murein L,D-transpeptidase catalytic domain family protein [Bacteroidota bacterium]